MDEATLRQVTAADPGESTWLSANAGSGKTRVLTDRVARLLLRGTEPQRILCLTYTKAAATEMQNRLFRRLGQWAMMPDADLAQALADLGEVGVADAALLGRARQLFARAIDTPGGLRIQTIHSFCAMLLRRFPLEAGVSPQFSEMDDRASQLLCEDILEEMSDGSEEALVRQLAAIVDEGSLAELIKEIVAKRSAFAEKPSPEALQAQLGLPPGFDEAVLLADVFLGGESDLISTITETLQTLETGIRERKLLASTSFSTPDLACLRVLERSMLWQSDGAKGAAGSAKIGEFPVKKARQALADRMPQIEALMLRVEAAMPQRIALAALRRTAILHDFATAFLDRYQAAKTLRGWLDFDDLIQHAKHLLTDPGLAAWVLYRLDGGIDHVLVDEAQDTSPDQWQVIESLTDDFFSGESRGAQDRTIFVVGDKKQSIYSFQGADVAEFDRMEGHFRAHLAGVNRALAPGELRHSFRSSQNILNLVDLIFQGAVQSAVGGQVQHQAFHLDQPGRIDLWPVLPRTKDPQDDDPSDPVDILGQSSAAAILAGQIANEIRYMIDTGAQIRIGGIDRAIHEGDVLILVRGRRSPLFAEIIKACKQAGLAIAGADRLRLGAEIAVKDMAALLAFLATPEDDLALATALRSPLCGLSEAELHDLAQPRKGYLWQELRAAKDRFGPVVEMLLDLLAQADFLRPYELIERVLTRHDGRRKFLARLGPEAEDGIDELLQQALAQERRDVPSLTRFLVSLQTEDVDIKRQADGAGRRIRVMTVHGAKGLEAPVVILPDTTDQRPRDRAKTVTMPDGSVMARPVAAEAPGPVTAQLLAAKARDAAEKLRLFYVALTRAQSWLIVAGEGEVKQDGNWYGLVAGAMAQLGAVPVGDGRQRHDFGAWPADLLRRDVVQEQGLPLPDWAFRLAPEPQESQKMLAPSELGGAKALPGEVGQDVAIAKARGSALHLLLEHLPGTPVADRAALAMLLVPDGAIRAAVWPEVQAILADDRLASLFGPESLAEVALTAAVAGRRMSGIVDRLVVGPDHVLAVDFKSNRVVPDRPEAIPEGVLAQLGAYAAALEQVYPERQVQVAVLWTAVPALMPVDRDIVRAALLHATSP